MLTVSKMRTLKGLGIGEQTVIGRLKMIDQATELSCAPEGATIALVGTREAALRLFDDAREEILGFVYFGDFDADLASLAKSAGISGIFADISEDFVLAQSEIAILYPQRSRVIISPDIEMLERFTEEIQSERMEGSAHSEKRLDYFYADSDKELLGLLGEEYCGCLVDMPLQSLCEEELFELFRDFAEFSDTKDTVICLGKESYSNFCEIARALMRAAVCGNLRVAVSASERNAPEEFFGELKAAERELILQGKEFEDIISRGIIIDSVDALVFFLSSTKKVDTVVLDADKLYAVSDVRESLECMIKHVCEGHLKRGGRMIVIEREVGTYVRGAEAGETRAKKEIFVAKRG